MALEQLVEQAYEVFSKYQLTFPLDVCPCCMDETEARALISTPLRQITQDQLGSYQGTARCYSEKEQQEACYFLPRILEFVSQNVFPSILTETVFDKVFDESGKRFIGTQQEQDFLQHFVLSYWRQYINSYPQIEDVASILTMIGRHFDLQPILCEWHKSRSTSALLHFVEFMMCRTKKGFGRDSYYAPVAREIDSWLADKNTKAHFIAQMEEVYTEEKYVDADDERNTYLRKVYIESIYSLYDGSDSFGCAFE